MKWQMQEFLSTNLVTVAGQLDESATEEVFSTKLVAVTGRLN